MRHRIIRGLIQGIILAHGKHILPRMNASPLRTVVLSADAQALVSSVAREASKPVFLRARVCTTCGFAHSSSDAHISLR